jgi:molybdopterin-guanine dinucleotide biosynthesis protein A
MDGPFDAVVLAGGRSARMGADKPGLLVGGRPMLGTVLAAARAAGAAQLIVVGPARPLPLAPVRQVQEDPPGAGPVPALRRGLAEVTAPAVAVLAADLPFLRAGPLGALRRALAGAAGAVLLDEEGRPQWLAGCWDTAALRRAAAGYQGSSLRGLLEPLGPAAVRRPAGAPGPPPWLDCDTPGDLQAARAWSEEAAR